MWTWNTKEPLWTFFTELILQKCEKARACIALLAYPIVLTGQGEGGTKGTAGYYSEASTMKMSGGKSWCIDGPSVNLTFAWEL